MTPPPSRPDATLPRGAVARRPVRRLGTAEPLHAAPARPGDDDATDAIAVEEPLEIRVDGEPVAVTMRTPGADADLALGFLLGEGLVAGAADVGAIVRCGRPGDEGYENAIEVRSAGGLRIDPDRLLEGARFAPASSACGVCGRRSIEGLLRRVPRLAGGAPISAALVQAGMAALRASQPVFARTGGLHAAAAVDGAGAVLAAAEDVGRHNAVDKVVGALARAGRAGAGIDPALRPALLAVSGRAGFEIVQKAAAAGIGAVASVSAPTSLAVDLAEASGLLLLGFVRDGRMTAYAHGERLVG